MALVGSLAALALSLSRQAIPSTEFWAHHQGWIIAALASTFIVPMLQAGIVEFGERGRRKELERQQNIEAVLLTSLLDLERHAGANIRTTGVQPFAVRGWWKLERQVRIGKVRLSAIPSSGVKWTKGKGVIGRCWATRTPKVMDLETYFSPYKDYDKLRWNRLDADIRFGLTYEEFEHLNGKYGVVMAVPIVDSKDKYVGCVSIDTPISDGVDETLREAEARASLAQTARLELDPISWTV